ncbi:WYL domain-containing protein [Bradyrhizobium diazoefficiens]|uniref:WYL domain-containing protein n=1 Tax=Bradyrhizobium diazoefficiens TaxID=1355477 RepID=UPI00190D177C|nr:WYL domain-containing protein [Bradyrhizobium diazoefficiens]MBK3666264.1 WYL domain-containing protein [Bradyrhizobium diazoefficiens]
MKLAHNPLRWGVEQRLEFIEFRLFWLGGVNRSDITGHFGVSVPQASNDLSQYQQLAPKNIVYDARAKRYFKTAHFDPLFLRPQADQYLSRLQSIADGTAEIGESWLADVPAVDVIRVPQRNVDPEILREIVEAIRKNGSLEIRYQSLTPSRPHAAWRRVSPHAFAFDGARWHVRAFCHGDRQFVDFLLSRILDKRNPGAALATGADDTLWHETIDVTLMPNQKLNAQQKKIVAQDYGMKLGLLTVRVRLALLYYFLKRLNLSFKSEAAPAHEHPIVLADPKVVQQALERARLA